MRHEDVEIALRPQHPPPGSNDLMALILQAEGDLKIFMAHLRYFKEALAKLRPAGASA